MAETFPEQKNAYKNVNALAKHFDLGVPNPFSGDIENGYIVKNTTGEDLIRTKKNGLKKNLQCFTAFEIFEHLIPLLFY
jgi:hypothetical protein